MLVLPEEFYFNYTALNRARLPVAPRQQQIELVPAEGFEPTLSSS